MIEKNVKHLKQKMCGKQKPELMTHWGPRRKPKPPDLSAAMRTLTGTMGVFGWRWLGTSLKLEVGLYRGGGLMENAFIYVSFSQVSGGGGTQG